jgi:hypothetical protein
MHRMRESGRWGVGKWVDVWEWECVCGCAVCKDKAASPTFRVDRGALPWALESQCPETSARAGSGKPESKVVLSASGSNGKQQQQQ